MMAKKVEEKYIETYYFSDTSFNLLMQNRIHKVLVICSSYDFFMLEEDGRIDEQIYNEYVSLNLSLPSGFCSCWLSQSSNEDTWKRTDWPYYRNAEHWWYRYICTGFTIERKQSPKLPIVVLTHFSREVSLKTWEWRPECNRLCLFAG